VQLSWVVRLQMAEDCLLGLRIECLLWRKPTLEVEKSAAKTDPIPTFVLIRISGAFKSMAPTNRTINYS